ncbi:hypothetical protein B0H34DRAFT_714013 [Crassisporium funariophilum]|nr:hypothetical protein B0H34DRAFT_714013 [Crassisporium funariophilum]
MFSKAFSALVLAASLLSVSALPAAAPQTPCADVHIIAARASGEAPGAGIIGALVTQVQDTSTMIVNAIVQMGDPRHVPDQSFDRGTSTRDGLFPRAANQQYSSTLQPRILSFCDANDPFCDSGNDLEVHLTYLDRDQDTAAAFILQQIGG